MIKRRLAAILASALAFIIAVVITTIVGPKPVTDYSTLLDYLRDSGASVVEKGELGWSFFCDGPEGRGVAVNESNIDAYEYTSAEAMEAEASFVSPDGYGINKNWGDGMSCIQHVGWMAPPHFYKSGRIIVLYIGEDDSIMSLLKNGLGRQFAGR